MKSGFSQRERIGLTILLIIVAVIVAVITATYLYRRSVSTVEGVDFFEAETVMIIQEDTLEVANGGDTSFRRKKKSGRRGSRKKKGATNGDSRASSARDFLNDTVSRNRN
ncbi:MAG: hypothetical protein NC097_00845 [Clostridium sp.]|nr:hypothetical protein [Prevotella sp.]MCM1428328.1 hypothetical protein [Clostridium sp.]